MPSGWSRARLGDVCLKPEYGLTASATQERVGPRLLRITDIQAGRVNWSQVPYCKCSDKQASRYALAPGDLLVARIGATTGKTLLVRSPDDSAVFASYLIRLRTKPQCDPRFLSFFTQTADYWGQIDRAKGGRLKGGVSQTVLADIELPLPNLREQRVIAHVLSTLQRARETTEQVLAATRRLAESLMRHLFTYGLTPPREAAVIPCRETVGLRVREDWPVRSLGEAATWLSGGTPSTANPAFWNGTVPWISAASLIRFHIADSPRRVTDLGIEHGTRVIPAGVTLAVVRGMSLRKEFRVGITMREVAFGQDCKALLPDDDFDPLYFAYAVKAQTPTILQMVDRSGHGTGRLGTDQLSRVEIPVPEREVQAAIANTMTILERKIEMEEHRRDALDGLFRSLLNDLMTGRRRVSLEAVGTAGIGA